MDISSFLSWAKGDSDVCQKGPWCCISLLKTFQCLKFGVGRGGNQQAWRFMVFPWNRASKQIVPKLWMMKRQPFLVMFEMSIQRTLTNGPRACWECRFIKRNLCGIMTCCYVISHFHTTPAAWIFQWLLPHVWIAMRSKPSHFSGPAFTSWFPCKFSHHHLIRLWSFHQTSTKVREMTWNGGIIKMPWQQHLCRVEEGHQILIHFLVGF